MSSETDPFTQRVAARRRLFDRRRQEAEAKTSALDPEPEAAAPATSIWLAIGGLSLAVGLTAIAAESGGALDGVALLTAAAAAGGLGLFALAERLGRTGPLGRAGAARREEARAKASFERMFEEAPEIAALVDRAGRLKALNRAGSEAAATRGVRVQAAADLLFDDADPQRAAFEALRDTFEGDTDPDLRAPERPLSGGWRLSVSPAGGDLALWRLSPPAPQGREASRAAAGLPVSRAARAEALDFPATADAAGVAWFTLGPTGRVTSASPLFERWTGRRGGPSPSLAALLPDLADRLAPEPRQAEGEIWASRLIGAEAAPRAVSVALAPLPGGAGCFGLAAPLPEAAAGAAGCGAAAPLALGPAGGVEERRLLKAFDELPAEHVVTEAAIGVLALSGEGRVLRLNAAADRLMTERAAAAGAAEAVAGPVGDHFIDWVAEEDREQAEGGVAAAARGGVAAFEARLVGGAGGEGRLVQCYLSAVETAAGRILLCHLIDASEGRGLEKNFIQSQKLQAVGQLAGGVAHDFNNLLTVIIGSADALLKRMTDSDPAYGDLNAIRQSGRRAAWLVGQLLAFSRKQTLTPKVADLTERCSEFVFLLARVIGEKYEIETEFEEGLWPVEVDVNQFEQVITNLVVNASHAMKSGGVIRLSTANERVSEPRTQGNFTMPPGDYARVAVEDQGCGIAREALAKIFEPFFTTKPVGQGTGLGLAVVYGVVKQSNGFVFVDSEENVGTRFTIYLPRVSAERAAMTEGSLKAAARPARAALEGADPTAPTSPTLPSPTLPSPRTGASAGADLPDAVREAAAALGAGRVRAPAGAAPVPAPAPAAPPTAAPSPLGRAEIGVILLVEDQAAVRAFAARSLAERGHHVLEAESGAEALAILNDEGRKIDLMLSDVVLEDTDGPSVLRQIGDRRPEMRVIFMSGYARDAFAETLESAAAHAREARFLQKPFTLDELAEAVAEALDRSA